MPSREAECLHPKSICITLQTTSRALSSLPQAFDEMQAYPTRLECWWPAKVVTCHCTRSDCQCADPIQLRSVKHSKLQ
jgi:hypothetical protein